MAEETESSQQPDGTQIRQELLAKSKVLKEKTALLKVQMNETAKAVTNFCTRIKRISQRRDQNSVIENPVTNGRFHGFFIFNLLISFVSVVPLIVYCPQFAKSLTY